MDKKSLSPLSRVLRMKVGMFEGVRRGPFTCLVERNELFSIRLDGSLLEYRGV